MLGHTSEVFLPVQSIGKHCSRNSPYQPLVAGDFNFVFRQSQELMLSLPSFSMDVPGTTSGGVWQLLAPLKGLR